MPLVSGDLRPHQSDQKTAFSRIGRVSLDFVPVNTWRSLACFHSEPHVMLCSRWGWSAPETAAWLMTPTALTAGGGIFVLPVFLTIRSLRALWYDAMTERALMDRFMFGGLPWFDPGSFDRLPVAVQGVPTTTLLPNEGPCRMIRRQRSCRDHLRPFRRRCRRALACPPTAGILFAVANRSRSIR